MTAKPEIREIDASHDRLRQALASGGDDTNPEFLFAITHTALLQAIEIGLVDPAHLAHRELVRRGLGAPATDSTEPEADTATQQAVAEIACRILRMDSLEARNSDALDFHELAVWTISDALTAAYDAGVRAAGGSTKRQEG